MVWEKPLPHGACSDASILAYDLEARHTFQGKDLEYRVELPVLIPHLDLCDILNELLKTLKK